MSSVMILKLISAIMNLIISAPIFVECYTLADTGNRIWSWFIKFQDSNQWRTFPIRRQDFFKESVIVSFTHWGRGKMADILLMIFSNVFSWMKMYGFGLNFHWSFPNGPINNIIALVRRRLGDKPLSKIMMVRLLTYICVIRRLTQITTCFYGIPIFHRWKDGNWFNLH